ncbi:MAG: glycosyltransferase, partial [Bryobacteraceae bacterium]
RAQVKIPFVTILTDFADYPPHFWMEHQDQYLICGTDYAHRQAVEFGYRKERVFRVSGMILRPGFYQTFQHDRAAERIKLGLRPELPTGIILFGGQGSPRMLQIVRSLQSVSQELQLILICGRNEKLASELRAIEGRLPKHVVGFSSEIPYYMSLSDFFIGKPGPGSISEAVAMHLPVIIERNAWTLPQERYNTDWVIENEVGAVVPSFAHIVAAVENLLEPRNFSRYRANTCAVRNSGVEIPDILDKILKSIAPICSFAASDDALLG